jgi:hypothetical protein
MHKRVDGNKCGISIPDGIGPVTLSGQLAWYPNPYKLQQQLNALGNTPVIVDPSQFVPHEEGLQMSVKQAKSWIMMSIPLLFLLPPQYQSSR